MERLDRGKRGRERGEAWERKEESQMEREGRKERRREKKSIMVRWGGREEGKNQLKRRLPIAT